METTFHHLVVETLNFTQMFRFFFDFARNRRIATSPATHPVGNQSGCVWKIFIV